MRVWTAKECIWQLDRHVSKHSKYLQRLHLTGIFFKISLPLLLILTLVTFLEQLRTKV